MAGVCLEIALCSLPQAGVGPTWHLNCDGKGSDEGEGRRAGQVIWGTGARGCRHWGGADGRGTRCGDHRHHGGVGVDRQDSPLEIRL